MVYRVVPEVFAGCGVEELVVENEWVVGREEAGGDCGGARSGSGMAESGGVEGGGELVDELQVLVRNKEKETDRCHGQRVLVIHGAGHDGGWCGRHGCIYGVNGELS